MPVVPKHPLAFNVDREPIILPRNAYAWRVKKVPRGSLTSKRGEPPEFVLRDGVPLFLPVTASFAELRRAVGEDGLFRLDAVDASMRVIREVEPAYVEVKTPLRLGELDGDQLVIAGCLAVAAVCLTADQPASEPPPLLPRTQNGGLPMLAPHVENGDGR